MPDEIPTNENSKASGSASSGIGMAIMRLGLGAMFLYVFFENLGKGLYSKDGYAKLINYHLRP